MERERRVGIAVCCTLRVCAYGKQHSQLLSGSAQVRCGQRDAPSKEDGGDRQQAAHPRARRYVWVSAAADGQHRSLSTAADRAGPRKHAAKRALRHCRAVIRLAYHLYSALGCAVVRHSGAVHTRGIRLGFDGLCRVSAVLSVLRAERTQSGAERRACYKVHGLQPAGGARTQARADPSALLRVRVAPHAYPRARSLRPVRPVLSIAAWHCGGFSQLRSCANQQRQPQPTNVAAELQRLRRLPQTAHRQCGRTVLRASVSLTGVRHFRRKDGLCLGQSCLHRVYGAVRNATAVSGSIPARHGARGWVPGNTAWHGRMVAGTWARSAWQKSTISFRIRSTFLLRTLSCLQPCETPVPSSSPCMRPKYCPVPCTLTPHRCATMCHSKAWQSTP